MCSSDLEPEILFGLATVPPPGLTDLEALLSHVAWYAHSTEIVQCHFPGWKAEASDYCADDVCHALFVIGPPRSIDRSSGKHLIDSLANCQVDLRRNNISQQMGRGANVLGHPLLALARAADLIHAQTALPALQPGEIISTGTLTDALPVAAGEIGRAHV